MSAYTDEQFENDAFLGRSYANKNVVTYTYWKSTGVTEKGNTTDAMWADYQKWLSKQPEDKTSSA